MGFLKYVFRRSNPTLRGRLLLLVASVALPLLTLAALAVWRAYDGERLRIGERLTAQARAMAFSIDREFERAEALLHLLATAPALRRGDLAAFEPQMRALSKAQFDGEHLALTTADGTQVINTAWPPGTRRPGTLTSAAAREALATGRAVISDLHRGVATGRPMVTVVVPDSDGGAAPAFALNGTLPLRRLARVLTQQGVPEGWAAAVLDRAGIVVARTHRPEETVGQRAMPLVAEAVTAERAPSALLIETPTLDGVPSVVALGRATRSGYWVALAAPQADFTGPLRTALAQLLAVGAALLAAGLALAFILARRVRASLRILAHLGTTGVPTPQPAGLREVDDVAAALAAAERRRRVLVAELNHRVKNMLATVQSVALQTLKGHIDDAAGCARLLTARLRALSAAHDLITAGHWEATPVDAVLRGALGPWLVPAEGEPRLRIEAPAAAARIGPLPTQTLVFALNELATNATQHGALSVPDGQVTLTCATAPGGRLEILWTERGGPPLPEQPERQGYGLRLLQRAVARDLGPDAEVALQFGPPGLQARILFRPAA